MFSSLTCLFPLVFLHWMLSAGIMRYQPYNYYLASLQGLCSNQPWDTWWATNCVWFCVNHAVLSIKLCSRAVFLSKIKQTAILIPVYTPPHKRASMEHRTCVYCKSLRARADKESEKFFPVHAGLEELHQWNMLVLASVSMSALQLCTPGDQA